MNKYKKTLVANRGEIAVRVIKALKEMGIKTVAVYSYADRDALHTKIADESVCIGPANAIESYLNTYRILSAASMKQVDSIHPGIGFLAENSDFPELCNEYGLDFIGPSSDIINLMGNKDRAKKVARDCGLPIIKGSDSPVKSLDECRNIIKQIGTPVVLKAASGGGGKGIRIIADEMHINTSYNLCKKEAEAAFHNDDLIIEQFLQDTRHVEVQVLGDKYGNVIHLGDRECTIQRANQKLIEEARCININDEIREKLYTDAVKLAKHIGYVGAGTVEFLVLQNGKHYFLEMNTRLQVEHTITELVTGIDIVKEQIKVSGGEKLTIRQEDVQFKNYAMQCRILAEDVKDSFVPSFGKISGLSLPGGFGVRVDSGFACNDTITPYYDSLLLKLCCFAADKESAIKKMRVCLEEIYIDGIHTNIDFLKFIINDQRLLEGTYNEKYVGEKILEYQASRCKGS